MKKSPNAFKILIAGIIDLLLCSILSAIIGSIALTNLSLWSFTLHEITSALIIPTYFILITYFNNGRTIGKAIFGLKIFSDLNEKITIKQALKRDGVLMLPAFAYLAWHLPYIDKLYNIYEATVTGNYQKLGGFIVQSDISIILSNILGWSGLVWILLEFISILANKENTTMQDRLSETKTLKE